MAQLSYAQAVRLKTQLGQHLDELAKVHEGPGALGKSRREFLISQAQRDYDKLCSVVQSMTHDIHYNEYIPCASTKIPNVVSPSIRLT